MKFNHFNAKEFGKKGGIAKRGYAERSVGYKDLLLRLKAENTDLYDALFKSISIDALERMISNNTNGLSAWTRLCLIAFIKDAKNGGSKIFELINDRVLGKPTQTIEQREVPLLTELFEEQKRGNDTNAGV